MEPSGSCNGDGLSFQSSVPTELLGKIGTLTGGNRECEGEIWLFGKTTPGNSAILGGYESPYAHYVHTLGLPTPSGTFLHLLTVHLL